MLLSALASGLGGALASGLGSAADLFMNKQNMDLQRQENQITRDREDNAVQRRSADLEAAGMSKTLAAGGAAGAQQMTAPRNQPGLGSGAVQNAYLAMKMKEDISQTKAAVELTKAQADKARSEAEYLRNTLTARTDTTIGQNEMFRKSFSSVLNTLKNNESIAYSKSVQEKANAYIKNMDADNRAELQKAIEASIGEVQQIVPGLKLTPEVQKFLIMSMDRELREKEQKFYKHKKLPPSIINKGLDLTGNILSGAVKNLIPNISGRY